MTANLPDFIPLTLAERQELLWCARQSIRAALHGEAPPECRTLTAALSGPGAAFVSLHHDRRLRGCIGTLAAEQPLYRVVSKMAVSAAFDDPRFPPLDESELLELEIEVSRLSPLLPARAEEICIGRHGVCITHGEHRAVFLPQVALEQKWDRATLLGELCRKALLAPDAWKSAQANLTIFEAEVFKEDGLRAPQIAFR